MLASVVIDITDYDDYDDRDRAIQVGLREIIRSVSRVILLHAT